MDFAEISKILIEEFPDKMIVNNSDFKNQNNETYKALYEIVNEEKNKFKGENQQLLIDRSNLEKELDELKKENKRLRVENYHLCKSVSPTMKEIKNYCNTKIVVTDIKIKPEEKEQSKFDINNFIKKISDNPGIYGTVRPSWFTCLNVPLSKESVQRKNICHTVATLMNKIMFWKNIGDRINTDTETAAEQYEFRRRQLILDILNDKCSNEEKYLKYLLLSPGIDKEYQKTINGASELNIDARLLIALLEQPNDQYNRDVIESYVSKLHKGTEYNLKHELAMELLKGEWYIEADVNGKHERMQLISSTMLNDFIAKVNSIEATLRKNENDELSANLAESSSNEFETESVNDYITEEKQNEISEFIDFSDADI